MENTVKTKDVILIGGAPCAGKSTLAAALAKERNVAFASIDRLREQFQNDMVAEKEHYPWLFYDHRVTAEEFWKNKSPQQLVKMENEQAREFWPTLKKNMAKGEFGIFEGVSMLPELVWKDFGKDIPIVFLIDANRERVWQTIQTRGLWGAADTYADWIKPLELEWVMLHNEWFREQVKKLPYPLIEVGDRDNVLQEVLAVLDDHKQP